MNLFQKDVETHYLDIFSRLLLCDLQHETFILISLKTLVVSHTMALVLFSHELHRDRLKLEFESVSQVAFCGS